MCPKDERGWSKPTRNRNFFEDAGSYRAIVTEPGLRYIHSGQWYCEGVQGMRMMTVAFALGAALVLCELGTFGIPAEARQAKVVREPRERLIVTVPVERPYWDSNIVPRYRYRPQDDRVDPYGPPVVPVVRLWGGGEVYLPSWNWIGP